MHSNLELQIERICNWLSQNADNLEAGGAVFELRADINSATTAAIAKKVFAGNLLGLIFSCHNSAAEMESAESLAKSLEISYKIVDFSGAYDLLTGLLPGSKSDTDITSRLCMIVLYQYAKARNYVVLGTIARSEWEIGNFTKHGNGAADLFPILHLLQSELHMLSARLNLPAFVTAKPIDASSQTNELDRAQLDSYLAGALLPLSENILFKIQQMKHAAQHKKLPQVHYSLLEGAMGRETPTDEAQETYDKSIEALTLISKAITSDQYLEDILRLIVMVTAEVMNSSVCSLWLLDEKEGVMRLRATQSIDREYLQDRVLKVGEGVVGKVVVENRPYVVTNVLTDPYYKEKELARRMGLVSMLSVPMRVKERVIGVINCYTSHPHAFSDLQMNVLTTVANQAAVAIEKTELMVQTKVIQEELEKRKMIERAKDLLMKRFHLAGEEAYRWLQKRSMNTRKSMREVAEAVILTMEG
jgi:NAD+ synthetase